MGTVSPLVVAESLAPQALDLVLLLASRLVVVRLLVRNYFVDPENES